MFNKGFLFAVFLIMTSPVPARAETACQMIDKILATVFLVRDIQIDQNDRHYAGNMSKLAALVDEISLPMLVPPSSQDALSTESTALFHYISSLREAVAGAKSGYDDHARRILNTGMTREFTASLQSLDDYWQCTPETPSPGTEAQSATKPQSAAKKPVGAADTKMMLAPGSLAGSGLQAPPTRSSPAGKGGWVQYGLVTPLSNASLLFSLTLMALFGMFYFMHKRARNYKVRDTRCFVQMVSKMRLGQSVHGITIVDISMNGAKIQHRKRIKTPGKLQIELDGIWYPGQIIWRNQQFAGIKFDRPIGAQVFNTVLQSVATP